MTQDMNLLQLTVEQRAQAMAVFGECADLREFGCRMLEAVMNAVMDADAQDTCGAARGERTPSRNMENRNRFIGQGFNGLTFFRDGILRNA